MGTHLGMTDNNNDLIHPDLYNSSWVDTIFNGTNWSAVEAANAGNIETSNVKPAFFYTKPFVYNSVASCLIMIKLLHHTV